VEGFVARPNGIGVRGFATHESESTSGVVGLVSSPRGIGVVGVAGRGGTGVMGYLSIDVPAAATAVMGASLSNYPGPVPGGGGFGVYGYSANGHAVVGWAAGAGGGAVVGSTNGAAGANAGIFFGGVFVRGDFTVIDGVKSAAVPHSDGTHRRLYCVESPESWFEDFGKGQLACGRADVAIDPDFAVVARLDDYHVFLTAYDAGHLLHVTNQTPAGFTVLAQDRTASGRFSWRVVAKRKDVAAARFETVPIPSEPELPTPQLGEFFRTPAPGTRSR